MTTGEWTTRLGSSTSPVFDSPGSPGPADTWRRRWRSSQRGGERGVDAMPRRPPSDGVARAPRSDPRYVPLLLRVSVSGSIARTPGAARRWKWHARWGAAGGQFWETRAARSGAATPSKLPRCSAGKLGITRGLAQAAAGGVVRSAKARMLTPCGGGVAAKPQSCTQVPVRESASVGREARQFSRAVRTYRSLP